MTPRRITLVILGALLIVGAATVWRLVQRHPKNDFPKSSWTATGQTNPPAALTAFLLAASQGDGDKLLACLSPDLQSNIEQHVAKQIKAQGITFAQLMAQMGSHWAYGVTGFNILNQRVVSDDQIILHFQLQGKKKQATFKFKKIGDAWKLDAF